MKRVRVLFVCMGNICRSPLAEGIFRDLVEKRGLEELFEIDSAGTGAWHAGHPPDPRSVAVAARHGTDISGQRARQFHRDDFYDFDLILAMDRTNLSHLRQLAPGGPGATLQLFSRAAFAEDDDIPDPYYGGADGFEVVYTRLLNGCSKLLDRLDPIWTS